MRRGQVTALRTVLSPAVVLVAACLGFVFVLGSPDVALGRELAQEEEMAESLWTTDVAVDTLWTLVAGILVFFMNAGFGCLEAGFCRAKNVVNILAKNFVVFGISSLAFFLVDGP